MNVSMSLRPLVLQFATSVVDLRMISTGGYKMNYGLSGTWKIQMPNTKVGCQYE